MVAAVSKRFKKASKKDGSAALSRQLFDRSQDSAGSALAESNIGASVIDQSAPGAKVLLAALKRSDEGAVVLGIAERRTHRIVNAVGMGEHGVTGHRDIFPLTGDSKQLGGYSFIMTKEGKVAFRGSGTYPMDLSPPLKRSVLRYLGVRPARETFTQRWSRRMRDLGDRVYGWLSQGIL